MRLDLRAFAPNAPAASAAPAAARSASLPRLPRLADPAGTVRRYGVAVLTTALAWAFTLAAPPLHQLPTTLFFVAVTISTFYGYLGPGLLATALSTLALDYSFMAPVTDLSSGLGETVRIAAFALAASLINSLHERRRLAEAERRASEARERAVLQATARELERAHETVARALADRENVMETIPDVLYTLDLEGRLSGWNRRLEAVTGLGAEALTGRPLPELFLEDDRGPMAEGLRDALGKGYAEQEGRLLGRDGRTIPYQLTGVPLRNAAGDVLGITGVGRDLSERKRLEEELRQAQKMEAIGRLAGGVAHDFNNLLTVIMGRAQILLRRLGAVDEARRDLDLIELTAAHAADLVHQLLAFSRKQVLQARLLDLNAVVSELEQILRRLVREDIVLTCVLAPGLAPVKADRAQLEQVLMNLVVNARDAMPDGGRLGIETADVALDAAFAREHPGASPGPHVMLAVRDTGVGMNAETLARIFEPFFTTKGIGRGTGLGLATVYGIVNQHGGCITVDSAPGRGTAFAIYLPRADASVEPEADPPAPAPAGRGTVLVVEDEPEVRALACDILRRHGYTVLEAATPERALALSAEHAGRIHLVLADVVMPRMNGPDLARRVLAERPEAKVLYMSGYAHAVAGALEAGEAFLQKPFTAQSLARKVREALVGRGRAGHRRPAGGALPAG